MHSPGGTIEVVRKKNFSKNEKVWCGESRFLKHHEVGSSGQHIINSHGRHTSNTATKQKDLTTMKLAFLLSLLVGFVQLVPARPVRDLTVAQLFEMAPLAVTGEVISITPLGVETTLSYPTLHDVTFHWLRVTCNVEAVIKGEFRRDSIDVAMLAMKSGEGLFNPPLMLSPSKGQKYVMFLAPSSKTNVYASILAPYDEENAIFILDRKARVYDFSGVVSKDYMKQCIEKKEFVWSLVDQDGQLSKTGPKEVADRYKSQIEKKSRDFTIALEWKVQTNAAGWSIDVPKDTPEPKQK